MTTAPDAPRPGLMRETLRHTAIYSGAAMLGRMISFIMLPFYAHILRDIGYGVIGMIDASLALLGSLLAYEFSGALVRIYHEQPADRKHLVVPTGTVLVGGILLVICGLGSAVSAPLSSLLLGSSEYWHLIVLALVGFFFDLVASTAQTMLVIKRRSATYSVLSLVRLFVGLGLNIVLVVILRWDLFGYFLSSLVTAVVSFVLALVLLYRGQPFAWNREIARDLLAYQLPLVPGSIASFFSRQIERVVVRYQLDLSALGVLEMAYKFPVLIGMLVTVPFMRTWETTRMEIADEPGAPRKIGNVFTYFMYIILFAFLLLSVNIESILRLLTPPEFWPAAFIARIEAAQMVLKAMARHLGFGLFYAKRTKDMAVVMGVVAAVKVGLSYVMISTWGLYGAAWSALLAAAFTLVWLTVLSNRHYRFDVQWKRITALVLAAAAVNVTIDSFTPEQIAAWGEPVLSRARAAVDTLDGTWVAGIKDGKLLRLLETRLEVVFDLVVRTAMLSAYLLVGPMIHVETRRRILRFVRTGKLRA